VCSRARSMSVETAALLDPLLVIISKIISKSDADE
jgi:hypothetical protein